jgi:hypothetical protein
MPDEPRTSAGARQRLWRVSLSFDLHADNLRLLDTVAELVDELAVAGECIATIDGEPRNTWFRVWGRSARQVLEELAAHTVCDDCGQPSEALMPCLPAEDPRWLCLECLVAAQNP